MAFSCNTTSNKTFTGISRHWGSPISTIKHIISHSDSSPPILFVPWISLLSLATIRPSFNIIIPSIFVALLLAHLQYSLFCQLDYLWSTSPRLLGLNLFSGSTTNRFYPPSGHAYIRWIYSTPGTKQKHCRTQHEEKRGIINLLLWKTGFHALFSSSLLHFYRFHVFPFILTNFGFITL